MNCCDRPILSLEQEVDERVSISSLLEKIQLLKSRADEDEKLKECEAQLDRELKKISPAVTSRDMSYFKPLKGVDIFDRLQPFYQWKKLSKEAGLWYFEKTSISVPLSHCSGLDGSGHCISGVNFGSQDYLSLSSHREVKKAVIQAIEEYGVHSAGSPAAFGNTKFTMQLENLLAKHLKLDSVTLYPTGWGAGFGVITGLIRKKDHVVMDQLSHACLREGAMAATENVYLCTHLDNAAFEQKLKQIRSVDQTNAILVVTETLFSMDTDSPNIKELQEICHAYRAFLLIDIAHDFGCLGENGHGILEEQNMLGKVDLVIGSFSKTFASNGGFIGSNNRAVKEYLSFFSGPRIFSNGISPVQTAAVIKAFEIIESNEGKLLRNKLMENVLYMRKRLEEIGLSIQGIPSAIVPVVIGEEGLTRIIVKLLSEKGVITNIIEYPAVPKRGARLRIQVMANHTREDIDHFVCSLNKSLAQAKILREKIQSWSENKNTGNIA